MKRRSDSMHRLWTVAGVAVALALTVVFSCCGGSSSSGPSTVPTPAPVRNVIAQENFSGLQPTDPDDPEDFFFFFFTTGQVGTLDVTVDWTHDSDDLDVLLLSGTLEQALSPACQTLDESACPLEILAFTATLERPETLTVTNLPAGGYILAVANFGTTAESGVAVVGLTT